MYIYIYIYAKAMYTYIQKQCTSRNSFKKSIKETLLKLCN